MYAKDPTLWKKERKATIDKIGKAQAVLSLIETKSSSDPESPDRVRTMFRNDDSYFGSALQIVDSHYFVRLLRDRVEMEQYYDAYINARRRGLSCAAGCHFEELLHQVFHKLPMPVEGIIRSTGTGSESVAQLTKQSWYWIPSIPNFANLDAAIVLPNSDGVITVWAIQYTVAKHHSFNGKTFLVKFLQPVLKNFGLGSGDVDVMIYFVVPNDVFEGFKVPEEVEEAGYAALTAFVDCSTVETVSNVFDCLRFILQPVRYSNDEPP